MPLTLVLTFGVGVMSALDLDILTNQVTLADQESIYVFS